MAEDVSLYTDVWTLRQKDVADVTKWLLLVWRAATLLCADNNNIKEDLINLINHHGVKVEFLEDYLKHFLESQELETILVPT